MKTFSKLVVLVALLALGGGFAYFATMDVPVEQQTVTETLPNDRLSR